MVLRRIYLEIYRKFPLDMSCQAINGDAFPANFYNITTFNSNT